MLGFLGKNHLFCWCSMHLRLKSLQRASLLKDNFSSPVRISAHLYVAKSGCKIILRDTAWQCSSAFDWFSVNFTSKQSSIYRTAAVCSPLNCLVLIWLFKEDLTVTRLVGGSVYCMSPFAKITPSEIMIRQDQINVRLVYLDYIWVK